MMIYAEFCPFIIFIFFLEVKQALRLPWFLQLIGIYSLQQSETSSSWWPWQNKEKSKNFTWVYNLSLKNALAGLRKRVSLVSPFPVFSEWGGKIIGKDIGGRDEYYDAYNNRIFNETKPR